MRSVVGDSTTPGSPAVRPSDARTDVGWATACDLGSLSRCRSAAVPADNPIVTSTKNPIVQRFRADAAGDAPDLMLAEGARLGDSSMRLAGVPVRLIRRPLEPRAARREALLAMPMDRNDPGPIAAN
jgi:hypothetical protein